MTINKFYVLNIMQKNIKKLDQGVWEVLTDYKRFNTKNGRCVGMIHKVGSEYWVTRNGCKYKNFMAALGSLVVFYIVDTKEIILKNCQTAGLTDYKESDYESMYSLIFSRPDQWYDITRGLLC